MTDEELKKFLDSSLGDMAERVDRENSQKKAQEQKQVEDAMNKFTSKLPDNMKEMVSSLMSAMQSPANDSKSPISRETATRVAHSNLPKEVNNLIPAQTAEFYKNTLSTANLWLDSATNFSPLVDKIMIMRPIDWLDQSFNMWEKIITPIAKGTNDSMHENLHEQFGGLEEMTGENHPISKLGFNINGQEDIFPINSNMSIEDMMMTASKTSFSVQVGTSLSFLAKEAVCGTDFGFPLFEKTLVMVPQNVEKLAKEFELPIGQVVAYLCLREAAAERLFDRVPWLAGHLLSIIQKYAEGIDYDINSIQEKIMDQMGDFDPTNMAGNMSGMNAAITNLSQAGDLIPKTQAQKESQERLEVILSIIEGWIDWISFRAGAAQLDKIGDLRELMTRRRITGGKGENSFAKTIGINLRPTLCRESSKFWEKMYLEKGLDFGDSLWSTPDKLPTKKGLDNPEDFLNGIEGTSKANSAKDDVKIEHDWDSLLS
jgi:putative hydrolase